MTALLMWTSHQSGCMTSSMKIPGLPTPLCFEILAPLFHFISEPCPRSRRAPLDLLLFARPNRFGPLWGGGGEAHLVTYLKSNSSPIYLSCWCITSQSQVPQVLEFEARSHERSFFHWFPFVDLGAAVRQQGHP